MPAISEVLRWISAGLFCYLAATALVQWFHSRARERFLLFLAMASFGLIGVFGLLNEALGRHNRMLTQLTVVSLVASAYVMMEFRHAIVPLSRAARRALAAVAAMLTIAGLVVRFPGGTQPHLTPVQVVVAAAIIGFWLLAMIEPAIRFRSVARLRQPVERARLRLLSIGYAGVAAILTIGMVFKTNTHPQAAIALQLFTFVIAPFFFIAVAPPGRLRRYWIDRETERERARLLLTLPAMVWTVDADMRPTSVSTGGLGPDIDPMGWNGRTLSEHYEQRGLGGSEIARRVIDAHASALRGEAMIYDLEYEDTVYECRIEPIHGPDGVAGAIGIALDVSERRRTEAALRQAFDRERDAAQRLRSLDEMKNSFLNAVSHELRTPLTSVLGLAATLRREDLLQKDERAHVIDRLIASAEKLQTLLGDLLDLDRLRRGIVEPRRRATDVGELVAAVARSFAAESGRAVLIGCENLTCEVDAPKIERIVENLLLNAQKYTPETTRVWVSVRSHDDGALISVEDEGPGVPAELAGPIFEPFRQGGDHAHAPGVGIGLSLVANFAALHEGRAWVEDRRGGGASFRVWLPDARRVLGRATA